MLRIVRNLALFDKILCSRGDRKSKKLILQTEHKAWRSLSHRELLQIQKKRGYDEYTGYSAIHWRLAHIDVGLTMTYLTATRGFVIRDSWLYLPVSKRHHPHPCSRSIAALTISNVPGPSSICLRLLLSNITSPPNTCSYPPLSPALVLSPVWPAHG